MKFQHTEVTAHRLIGYFFLFPWYIFLDYGPRGGELLVTTAARQDLFNMVVLFLLWAIEASSL